MSTILVNGEPGHVVDVLDRGLQYGDGLFETVAVLRGRPRLWQYHMARLADGCERLGLAPPAPEVLADDVRHVAGGDTCVAKIILTRGIGGRGYRAAPDSRPTRICQRSPWPAYTDDWHDKGAAVRLCTTRLAPQPALAGFKHLNRLEQVLARSEWNDPTIAEGLMLDVDGALVCGTQSNLFLRRGDRWLTPSLDRCGVRGVMRAAITAAAGTAGLVIDEASLSSADLADADEAFLSNALIGVWPIVAWEQHRWRIGDTTRRIQSWIAAW